MKNFEEYIKAKVDKGVQPNNIIDATVVSTALRKAAGVAVIVHRFNEYSKVTSIFSFTGFFFFFLWSSIYIYCAYAAVVEKQTILRKLYNTKLKGYGDMFEWYINTVYVAYSMWKVPFSISGSVLYIQAIIDIDKVVREMDENLDYVKCSTVSILVTMGQIVVGSCHMFSLWVTQANMRDHMPYALMFHIVVGNLLAMVTTSHYCFYLYLLGERFTKLNFIIGHISPTKISGSRKSILMTDRLLCEKIRLCARIYAKMYQAIRAANRLFGLAIAMSMGKSLFSIILNSFYLMEALAAELFKEDVERFSYFLVYIFWEIFYAFLIILLNIMICEKTKKKGKRTAYLTHDVINKNISPAITEVAMQLSQQLVHQSPSFSAGGLYKLEYGIMLHICRMVGTFQIMLLQFATNKYGRKMIPTGK